MGPVPIVDRRLKLVALGQQGAVLGREVMGKFGEAAPERGRVKPGAGQRLAHDEVVKNRAYPQPVMLDHVGHEPSR